MVGLSLDKSIAVQEFYTSLKISKSQVDSLLNRLMKEWLPEFEALCQLLAVSAMVQADALELELGVDVLIGTGADHDFWVSQRWRRVGGVVGQSHLQRLLGQ